MVGLLLLFGGSLVTGLLAEVPWRSGAVAVLLVFVVRPLSGHVSLIGSRLAPAERWTIAFFGIRGFGSVYYLAYATRKTEFDDVTQLWVIVALAMLISIATHGVTANAAMSAVDRAKRRHRST